MSLKTAIYTVVFLLAAGMVITLLVFWPVFIVRDYHTIKELYAATHADPEIPTTGRWTVLTLGVVFLSIVLVVLGVFFYSLLRGSRFKQQQKDFVNMVTHELKLPMSSIQMFAQTLQQHDATGEERRKFLEAILNDCARMNQLLDHLLKSQQIERGKLPVHRRRVDVKEFLEEFAGKWPRPLDLRTASMARDRAQAQADPVLLELALTNLVSNAEKYGRGAVPRVALEADARTVRISVEDGGAPIPKKYAKKIFKRFFRMPTRETRRQNGAGLGLYIVKSIMRVHKGSVALSHRPPGESAPAPGNPAPAATARHAEGAPRHAGGGNRFTLSLPRSA